MGSSEQTPSIIANSLHFSSAFSISEVFSSSCINTTDPAISKPSGCQACTALRVVSSKISSIDGRNFNSAAAACAARVMSGKVANKVAGGCGRTSSPTVISVMIPSEPSEPIKRCKRSNVETDFLVALPRLMRSPLANTTLIART